MKFIIWGIKCQEPIMVDTTLRSIQTTMNIYGTFLLLLAVQLSSCRDCSFIEKYKLPTKDFYRNVLMEIGRMKYHYTKFYDQVITKCSLKCDDSVQCYLIRVNFLLSQNEKLYKKTSFGSFPSTQAALKCGVMRKIRKNISTEDCSKFEKNVEKIINFDKLISNKVAGTLIYRNLLEIKKIFKNLKTFNYS